jgi:hypothetical protein
MTGAIPGELYARKGRFLGVYKVRPEEGEMKDPSRSTCRAWLLIAFVFLSSRAFAQTDLSGVWGSTLHEDIGLRLDERALAGGIAGAGGPHIGDYTGLPINDAARLMVDSWDARINTAREHQTIVQPAAYWVYAGGGLRISTVVDDPTQQVVAIKIYRAGLAGSTTRMIWMDGRPHPPEYAAHTWQGFSTGIWDGNILTVETTHLKAGWIRRNGVPASDRATLTEHIARHGNYLTIVRAVNDPIYLEEPFVITLSWILDLGLQLVEPEPSEIVDEIPGRPAAFVPHFLPGTNDQLKEFASEVGLPFEATRGGKETTYPEYQLTLKALMAKQPKVAAR